MPSSCFNCSHFSDLTKPRRYDEINFIYGYCFKDLGEKLNGYPVYIPSGVCKNFCLKPNEEKDHV